MSDATQTSIYSNDVKERSVSTENLQQRLLINKKYQSKNFSDWLFNRLNVVSGEIILDVGCGTGAQTSRFLENIGQNGQVDALDISESSVTFLNERHKDEARLNAVVADMANLEWLTKTTFKNKYYSLAHASYSIYYSPSRMSVLNLMAARILPTGRVAVFTPVAPHGMVEIARNFSKIPQAIDDCFAFGKNFLEPEFRKLFWEVEIHFFQSEMIIDSITDFIDFYRATTYYDVEAEQQLRSYAQKQITSQGALRYEKNGYLIIGCDKK